MRDEGLDLDQAAARVRQLEREAIEMHSMAQRLNKEGRFEEAQTAYAAMHRLEDEASALAARVGCVACVLGDAEGDSQPSLCSLDPETLLPYQRLHVALPWPSRGAPASQQDDAHHGGPLLGAGQLAARAASCVVGSSLADAAAMGVHWVYDMGLLNGFEYERRSQATSASTSAHTPMASTSTPAPSPPSAEHPFSFGLEFMEPPRSPFYAYASGRNSPYGEQTLVLLRSLADSGGLHCGHYADLFAATFGPDSGFDGYRDVSTKGFLRNFGRGMPPPLSGADDAQANCIARLAPLVAAFAVQQPVVKPALEAPPVPPLMSTSRTANRVGAGVDIVPRSSESGTADRSNSDGADAVSYDLLSCVALATRVTQNTDAAVAWACVGAAVLELIVLGSSAQSAVEHIVYDLRSSEGRLKPFCGSLAPELAAHLDRVLELRTTPVTDAVAALGRNCHMPNALQTPLQVVLYVEHLSAIAGARVGRDSGRRPIVRDSGRRPTATTVSAPADDADACGTKGVDGVVGSAAAEGQSLRPGLLPAEAFVWGVRLAVREGGCCASRAAYVGACLGAMVMGDGEGTQGGLPAGWLAKYPQAEKVQEWARAIVEARGGAGVAVARDRLGA